MKNFMRNAAITVAAACLFAILAVALYAENFEGGRAWRKLDSTLQNAWTEAKGGDMSARLDCFVRVRSPADSGDRAFLEDKGFVVRAFSGTIASGHLKVADLPSVAGLPFVDSIRSAKKTGE